MRQGPIRPLAAAQSSLWSHPLTPPLLPPPPQTPTPTFFTSYMPINGLEDLRPSFIQRPRQSCCRYPYRRPFEILWAVPMAATAASASPLACLAGGFGRSHLLLLLRHTRPRTNAAQPRRDAAHDTGKTLLHGPYPSTSTRTYAFHHFPNMRVS